MIGFALPIQVLLAAGAIGGVAVVLGVAAYVFERGRP